MRLLQTESDREVEHKRLFSLDSHALLQSKVSQPTPNICGKALAFKTLVPKATPKMQVRFLFGIDSPPSSHHYHLSINQSINPSVVLSQSTMNILS